MATASGAPKAQKRVEFDGIPLILFFGLLCISPEVDVDVIVEGKITPEEGIDEVIQTVIDLKAVQHAILRVTCSDSDLQGRVAFSQGGYILGGQVADSGETGYAAVKKLLEVRKGNYAILDPGRTYVPEVNQSLWIKGEKVIDRLPHLPESVDDLLDANPENLAHRVEQTPIGRIDIKADRSEDAMSAPATTVEDVKSKARQLDLSGAKTVQQLVIYAIAAIAGTFIAINYGSDIYFFILKALNDMGVKI
ncbi:MAG: hypothetical protein IT343_03965 [Candidatus Melainabacteria bacterium]|nr:hypothetical protein [Candidatus Melainabacteria bacterium]